MKWRDVALGRGVHRQLADPLPRSMVEWSQLDGLADGLDSRDALLDFSPFDVAVPDVTVEETQEPDRSSSGRTFDRPARVRAGESTPETNRAGGADPGDKAYAETPQLSSPPTNAGQATRAEHGEDDIAAVAAGAIREGSSPPVTDVGGAARFNAEMAARANVDASRFTPDVSLEPAGFEMLRALAKALQTPNATDATPGPARNGARNGARAVDQRTTTDPGANAEHTASKPAERKTNADRLYPKLGSNPEASHGTITPAASLHATQSTPPSRATPDVDPFASLGPLIHGDTGQAAIAVAPTATAGFEQGLEPQAQVMQVRSSNYPRATPSQTAPPTIPALDSLVTSDEDEAERLADLVDVALREQARLHGVDLS